MSNNILMDLLSKTKGTLCSLIAAITLNCGSPSEVHEPNVSEVVNKPRNSTAIMITGNDSRMAVYDAFRNGNAILARHFQRSFNINNFNTSNMSETELHEMIREATKNSESIIISYNGHGGLREIGLVDHRKIDALYFPLGNVIGSSESRPDNRRENLRSPVRRIPQTPTEISRDAYEVLFQRLDEMNLPSTGLNLEYVQFYNQYDNQVFPQEILLLLSVFKGKIAFITNSCYGGQVNELVERDTNIQALAIASSPYNELSIMKSSVGELNRGGVYFAIALAAYLNLHNYGNRTNLAGVRPETDAFITFARNICSRSIPIFSCNGYDLRDEGFNFQRYSRINEFYF